MVTEDARSISLSVVLVTWNSRDGVERCLASIFGHTEGLTYEVIVVDNASSDDTVAAIRAGFPDVRIIENGENVGFARACNQGMDASTCEFLLLLNPDTYVEDNVIGRSVQVLREQPVVGMLGCRLCFPDGRLQHTANRALSIRRSLLERFWLYKLLPKRRRAEILLDGYWDHGHDIEVDWLPGAFMLLRRSLYLESGGFDERFFMYGEDSEWCMRLRRAGNRILFTPTPGTVFHTGSVSSDLVWTEKERLRRGHAGGIESYAALNGRALAACYRMTELLGSIARFTVYSAAGSFRSDPYYADQRRFYRWLIEFYLTGRGQTGGADAGHRPRLRAVRLCPACRASDSDFTGDVNGFHMRICRQCRTMFTAQLPAADDSTDYGAYYHQGNLEVPTFVRSRLEELVSDFDCDRSLNRWLDVGCGAGTLMQAARGRGWHVVGTEVAERAAEAMRAKGFDVRSGKLDQLDLPEAGFDVVSMIEVIEHVPDVDTILIATRRLLRPGGVLYLTTPHVRGISSRLLGTRWSVVSPPEHLQLFSIRGLSDLLERSGFGVRRARAVALNPAELLRAALDGEHAAETFRRVESSYRLNESLTSSRAGAAVKAAANEALNGTRLGDTIKLVAERRG